jgi:hypothetical protein
MFYASLRAFDPIRSPGSKQAAAAIGNLLDKVEVAKSNQLADMKKLEAEAKAVCSC